MLADSVEATVRSSQMIEESAIESVVERAIRNRFLEGQLDECDLTAGEMKIIKDQFVEILIGIHHPRIKYPGQPNEEPDTSAMVESFPPEPMPGDIAPSSDQPASPDGEGTQQPNNDLPVNENSV
jgi:hypothetical protein